MIRALLVVPILSVLTTCSDDRKPYVILKALDESYTNHVEFATGRSASSVVLAQSRLRVPSSVPAATVMH